MTVLCRVLEVTTSGFYAWCSRGESPRALKDRQLAVETVAAFKQFGGCYGSPRLHREVGAGRHRVARIMRDEGLAARPRRRFCVTTDSSHGDAVAPNLLGRNFASPEPNRIWAGDVTYLPTWEGWLFLAVLLDLHSRRVVGWAMSERNDDSLTLAALQMAVDQRQPGPGLLHHSDRGSTYTSGRYLDALDENQMIPSMSRRGNCWDNAVSESFFSTLDAECSKHQPFRSRAEARRKVSAYILGFYNPTRLHSYLGYMSPMDFERAA